jgi:hypothetical protein
MGSLAGASANAARGTARSLPRDHPIPNPYTQECSHPNRVAWDPYDTLDDYDLDEIVDTIPLRATLQSLRED